MLVSLDLASATPLYVQLRNQIVLGIGRGELRLGQSLPTVRQLAGDLGVNTMTVNRAYAVLKQEGFLEIDRRHGAKVSPRADRTGQFREKIEGELELLVAESALKGVDREEFLRLCGELFDRLRPAEEGQ